MIQVIAEEKESVKVLRECIDLQVRKSADYQAPTSSIKQSMHYRRGVETIHDMIHQKLLRAQSLMEAAHQKTGQVYKTPNFESLEDSYKDLINYASFAVAYIRGKMEGQDGTTDMFNEPKKELAADNVPQYMKGYAFVADKDILFIQNAIDTPPAEVANVGDLNEPTPSRPTTSSSGMGW